MDKGTAIRSALLIIALINQIFGTSTIALNEDQVTSITDAIYLLSSTVFTVVISIIAWYKNNFITKHGKAQKRALDRAGLLKKK